MERKMKKVLLPVLLATLGLAGCVAVPAYDAPYGYGPQVYAPAVVVRPAIVFPVYGYYGGRYGHRYYR
jgi:hypothetical protein